MSWVDALVFALVAVYFINLFFFQNYVIPSSSLEKSLLTGDYLFVSKASYGPRIPQTPLTMPLTQHTMPVLGCKSYIEWPQWDYRRAPGLGNVELNDIVVFNYPAGDSIITEEAYQTCYYEYCYKYGALAYAASKGYLDYVASKGYDTNNYEQIIYDSDFFSDFERYAQLDSLSDLERYKLYSDIYKKGRSYVASMVNKFGKIDSRPTDRRENYVKRCVGLPGQTLQIKNHIIYLDGKPNKEPENVQYSYKVKLNVSFIPDELQKELGISGEDQAQLSRLGYMPLTKHAYEVLKSRKDLVAEIAPYAEEKKDFVYPLNGNYGWTRDNYGPIWIPKKGESVKLTLKNLPIYERPIKVYEGNDLQVNDKGQILINGKVATSYTFKLDYYWMQGDNRHNSADSRYWGFVPEDHIVGKPIFIWWSSDPDRRGFGGIRWSRLFTFVENYN
jgi:signal peptidase I